MKFVLFCHAFTSCWNNGHAHFLRGVTRELAADGHRVTVCEPASGWSRLNALADGGAPVLAEAERLVPGIDLVRYDDGKEWYETGLDACLDGADVVLVHEWNEPDLVASIGRRRRSAGFQLLFHDPHHRAVTEPEAIGALALDPYDGILAFGESLRDVYDKRGWGRRAFTWHEAADTALFHPLDAQKTCDLIWVGNWGDGERSRELCEFLIHPAMRLALRARVHGVRYPREARRLLSDTGVAYEGWLPNHRAPAAFAQARVTVHVPRRAYNGVLAGIPTIRVFEALACGIPLICSPWTDDENLFPAGAYLQVADGAEMEVALADVLADADFAAALARKGREAILRAHTCRHRVEQLLSIVASLDGKRQAISRQAAVAAGEAVQ